MGLEYVRRTAREIKKPEKKSPDRNVKGARRERPASKTFKRHCFQCDGFRHRAFECPSDAKKGDGTRSTGSKGQRQDGSPPGSRTFLQFADQAGEKSGNQSQGVPSQGGNSASRTRPQTGTIVRSSMHADGSSARRVQGEASEQRTESKGSITPQLLPCIVREIVALKREMMEHQRRKEAEWEARCSTRDAWRGIRLLKRLGERRKRQVKLS